MADRLAPEDIEAIVSGVASNRQLMAGIVEQLKEALQPAPPTTTTGQEPSSQPARQDLPQQTQGSSRNTWIYMGMGSIASIYRYTGSSRVARTSQGHVSSQLRVTLFLLPSPNPCRDKPNPLGQQLAHWFVIAKE